MTFTNAATVLFFLRYATFATAAQTSEKSPYVCDLCYSITNEHPYPPPSLEEKGVYLPLQYGGKQWQPDQKLPTCLEVWKDALDAVNPGVFDESSCREMASMFAPQCCNEFLQDDMELDDELQESAEYSSSSIVAVESQKMIQKQFLRR
ncbi:hypothetical protein IV203_019057 [Nitzschia inconspicua]|uniref:Uncharacterized protein n=1 Tax=Nitzschia inconspicua TaxID=303405 RepID=A0A9K3LY68_9STRA|nr:hypothetical protein IV203_019057 [Nitzschia inconspicua]